MTDTQMHDTIRALYEGIFDADAWQRSLGALCQASGSSHAHLLVLDTVHERVLVHQEVNPMPEAVAAYREQFAAIDPALPFARRMAVGSWYIDSRELGPQVMRKSPFYGEFLRPIEQSSVMACLIERQPHYDVFLSLQRPHGHDHYSPEDARALDWAIPHMRQAMALRERTHQVSALAHASSQLMERLPFGVIVFRDDGKPLLSNSIGESWVRRLLPAVSIETSVAAPPGAARDDGGWTLSRPFADALRAVSNPASAQPAQALRAVDSAGRQAQVILMPLPPAHHLALDWQRPSVLVAIHEPGAAPMTLPTVLRELYGLTPAEIRLALQLSTGIGLPEACELIGIRRETGRTQLKAIFTKTGTGTQAQLAHLLTRLGVRA
ncbi:helix-turn-helix transcriptional regulator [Cupriavidus taiwanensis]|uniref:Putative transcriptional regulator DNA-binding HTH domain LuxR family n=1 Tax=Cupriavidus taiwanensis TaxID=164546 RepID=A0A7Z7J5U9_9BURK|nr:helix-turn-helix transcriptional regulator [Cupriavidus taiwanensis]SOY87144.1 putative transcriptional regulator; DNA-binding HTH domain LuxR family [Cupriavidus taiwanensis]SOZ01459.1 putative transcriptional regulator; DNA-binding HTH domain LuxR family [Cupriavidus taiwanensis]SOZ04361.1 putative transcriptional regulator; DNA-binding HTH domain LuxR family [Cupriavidus taiwanensis]SPC08993.1 putative transcriptional regulator; DNA-binding HTH domain LuxR family [Cupriavidus taiwanensis]